jgi:hypothetical protein
MEKDAKATVPLLDIKVGERFMLQNVEYERVGDKVEDGTIYCKDIKNGGAGLLSAEHKVVRK